MPTPTSEIRRRSIIALVGFMGSGKSTTGLALATQLNLRFIDLDDAIEAASGLPVHQWFARRGEAAFRAAERAALHAACAALAPHGGVLALGGGAFADAEIRDTLAFQACTVWLDLPLELIRRRIEDDGTRPLFRDPGAVARLFVERGAVYALADVRIDASAGPEATVGRITAALARMTPRDGPGPPA